MLVIVQVLLLGLPAYFLTSIIYEIYFSPLSRVPGPRLAAISHLWIFKNVLGASRCYATHEAFQIYGPLVRVSKSQVAFNHLDSISHVYGPKFDKGPWYVLSNVGEATAAFETQAYSEWVVKRKRMAPTYSMQNLQYFEPDIIAETLELAERIRIDGKQGLQPVDIMTLTRYYALDLVGLIALGDRFELVKEGNQHFIVELLDNVVKALIPKTLLPICLANWLTRIPIPKWQEIQTSVPSLQSYARGLVKQKLKEVEALEGAPNDKERATLVDRVVELDEDGKRPTENEAIVELSGHLFPGSSTVSILMSYTLYELALHPVIVEKLRNELEAVWPDNQYLPPYSTLQNLPFLSAVIQEAYRVHGPAQSHLDRVVPSGGTSILGHYLPAGTIVFSQAYTLHRDPAVFPNPEKFDPERWMGKVSEEQRASLGPFGYGVRRCVGMNLATIEFYFLITAIVLHFDIHHHARSPPASMEKLDRWGFMPRGGICYLQFVPRHIS